MISRTRPNTKAQRARAVYELAMAGDNDGEVDRAIDLYREALRLGYKGARLNLANHLTERGSEERAQGMTLYRAMARDGDFAGAWCLAMEYRRKGDRRGYFRWVATAARLGYGVAQRFETAFEAQRARGERPPMYFMDAVEAYSVDYMLSRYAQGALSLDEVRDWALAIVGGETAIDPFPTEAIRTALEAMADREHPLTPERATALIPTLRRR